MSWLYTIVFAGLMMSHASDPVHAPAVPAGLEARTATTQAVQQNETERIEKSFPLRPTEE